MVSRPSGTGTRHSRKQSCSDNFDFNDNELHKANLRRLNEGDGNRLTKPNHYGFTPRNSIQGPETGGMLYLSTILAASICIYLFDILSDISTANYFYKRNRIVEYYATISLAILPLTIINVFSFTLYMEDEPSHRMSTIWIIRIFGHIFHSGIFLRRIEALCRKLRYICLRSNSKSALLKEELQSSLVHENQRIAILVLIRSFLHDLPQLILQSYLYIQYIFQSSESEDNEIQQYSELCLSQMNSIFWSIISLTFSIMNYHHSRRFPIKNESRKNRNRFLLYLYQWIWLTGTTSSRIFAFSMALVNINPNTGLIYFAIISFHWLVYTIYFKNKNEGKYVPIEICSIAVPTSVQILMENARDWSLGIVHTFCFLGDFNSFWEDRSEVKTFNYLIFGEDMMFLIVWYFKSKPAHLNSEQSSWLWGYYNVALICYFVLFFTGIGGMMLYFNKLKQLTFHQRKGPKNQIS